MSKISNDGLQELTKNIKNPLDSLYDKVTKKGSIRWSDMKEEYDFIHKFLTRISNEWDTSGSDSAPDPTVIVNNKVYKAEQ
tara:strand:+ start:2569 stop:2811 length:243 start_codon:yes stop_codon:yes gene_type:complete